MRIGRIRALSRYAVVVAPVGRDAGRYVLCDFHVGFDRQAKGGRREHRNAVNFVRSLGYVYGCERTAAYTRASRSRSMPRWKSAGRHSRSAQRSSFPNENIARSPHDAADFIKTENVTYFSTVPSFLAMIDDDLPTVRLLVVGGEDCPPELVSRWAPGRRMLNTYGPTEATVVATQRSASPGARDDRQPVPGYTTYVLDDDLSRSLPAKPASCLSAAPASRAAISTGPS